MRRGWLNRSIALHHFGLDSDCTFNCVHHAGEFGKNAVASGVDNAPAELANHRKHGCLMPLEVTHCARFISAHQSTVTSDVCSQDGCKPA
jgi:hypothetical protein